MCTQTDVQPRSALTPFPHSQRILEHDLDHTPRELSMALQGTLPTPHRLVRSRPILTLPSLFSQ